MKQIKVSEATPIQLDWLVAKCESLCLGTDPFGLAHILTAPVFVQNYKPTTYWSVGGPIIEREKIALDVEHGDPWRARFGRARITFDGRAHHYHHQEGPTPLIAAMRCYVASKLGNVVEIPEELE